MSNVRFRMHPWSIAGFLFATYFMIWLAALGLHTRGKSVPIWLLRSVGIPFLCVREDAMQSSVLLRCYSRTLGDLKKIEYSYQAVVGFIAVWKFTFQDDEELVVSPHRAGLYRVLLDLERKLDGFSIEKWHREFAQGDVEDTLLLWRAKPHHPPISISRSCPGKPGHASDLYR